RHLRGPDLLDGRPRRDAVGGAGRRGDPRRDRVRRLPGRPLRPLPPPGRARHRDVLPPDRPLLRAGVHGRPAGPEPAARAPGRGADRAGGGRLPAAATPAPPPAPPPPPQPLAPAAP